MTMTTLTSPPEPFLKPSCRIDGRQFYDVVAELCEISERSSSRVEYFGRCFESLSKYLGAVVAVLNLRQGSRTLERTFSTDEQLATNWDATIDSLVLQAQTDEQAMTRFYRNAEGMLVAHALAMPIRSVSGRTAGAVAFILPSSSGKTAESQLLQLDQLLELIVENSPLDGTGPIGGSAYSNNQILKSVVRASDYRSIQHLAFAIVNSLCSKFNCEQVGIGLVRNRSIRLMAVSGLSEVPKNTPGMMAIQQAMATCLDRKEPAVVQAEGKLVGQIESSNCQLHRLWHRIAGESCVATIPLKVDGVCLAVISIRRKSSQPLMPEDLQRIHLLAESFAPALPLVDRASRSIVRHFYEAAGGAARELYSWKKLGQKFIAVAVCATMAWMIFGTVEYKILAPSTIVPEQVYTVSVPHEAMIAQVHVLPGQAVRTGDLLLQLDIKDLLIQQMSLTTAITTTQIEANSLLAERRHQQAFLLQSEIEVLKTDLHLITEKISRSEIRAPHAGIVLPTKVHQRIGQFVAIGEPLLELANENRWHLEVEVPEHQAQFILPQQLGAFQSSARPEQQLQCQVTKISPAAEVLRNKNVVIVEAVLADRESWMKIGMEGHVRIETGSKPVWWVHLHPVLDYVRLKLWL